MWAFLEPVRDKCLDHIDKRKHDEKHWENLAELPSRPAAAAVVKMVPLYEKFRIHDCKRPHNKDDKYFDDYMTRDSSVVLRYDQYVL